MAKKVQSGSAAPSRCRPNGLIPMAAVRRMVRQIAEKFQPDKIILFGSYGYGTPNAHSDIDILVVMPAKNEINQAIRICQAVDYAFPMDLIVSTPEDLRWRLEQEDWFLREIMAKGKILYEKTDSRMGPRGRLEVDKAAKLSAEPSAPAAPGGQRTDTKLWAAFVLSGAGR